MQNTEWTGSAGTDHWDVGVSHSFLSFFQILHSRRWILDSASSNQESRIEYRIFVRRGGEGTLGPTPLESIHVTSRGRVRKRGTKCLSDSARTCASPACSSGPRNRWRRPV